jgi:hypothetical protein
MAAVDPPGEAARPPLIASSPDDEARLASLRAAIAERIGLGRRDLTATSTAILLAVTFGFALVVQSGLFQMSGWILGDIAYHRGVALTMQGQAWQGEGPYPGLLSYYGGLYPLALGLISELFDFNFDRVVSVVSWFAGLAWPLALWILGGRIWPGDRLVRALFAFIGTVAGPLSTNEGRIWVASALPSGQNFWPLYPRDVGLVLMVFTAWTTLSPRAWVRAVGSGCLIGLTAVFHVQAAIITGLLAALWLLLAAPDRRIARAAVEVLVAGATALIVSAWWWLPRVIALRDSSRVVLTDYAEDIPLAMMPTSFLAVFGVTGVLAVVGLVLVLLRRTGPARLGPILIWLVALLPLVVLDRLAGASGGGLFSERRAWLLLGPALIALATVGAAALVSRAGGRAPLVIGLLIAVVVASSLPATVATLNRMQTIWQPGFTGPKSYDLSKWRPVWAALNREVRERGQALVVTYDVDAAWTWSNSGAQVVSLWLPGYFKLGFEPKDLTGYGYLERVALLDEAFARGTPGLCALGERMGASGYLLERRTGMIATHDLTAGARYRQDPLLRTPALETWTVGPGLTYRDARVFDYLTLAPGASFRIDWEGPGVRAIEIDTRIQETAGQPLFEVSHAGTTSVSVAPPVAGRHRFRVATPGGIGGPITITALRQFDLVRVSGLEHLGSALDAGFDGPVLIAPEVLCPAAS